YLRLTDSASYARCCIRIMAGFLTKYRIAHPCWRDCAAPRPALRACCRKHGNAVLRSILDSLGASSNPLLLFNASFQMLFKKRIIGARYVLELLQMLICANRVRHVHGNRLGFEQFLSCISERAV